jgi:hypothetical protein
MSKLKSFLKEIKEPLAPEQMGKLLKRSAVIGAVTWTVVYVLLAVNLIATGLLWPVVVIPLVSYALLTHLGKIVTTYAAMKKKLVLGQSDAVGNTVNVVVNGGTSLSAEEIAEAAARAVQDLRLQR